MFSSVVSYSITYSTSIKKKKKKTIESCYGRLHCYKEMSKGCQRLIFAVEIINNHHGTSLKN